MNTSEAYSSLPSDYDVVVRALHAERCFEPFNLSVAYVGSVEMSYETLSCQKYDHSVRCTRCDPCESDGHSERARRMIGDIHTAPYVSKSFNALLVLEPYL
jgi:hypothetical protein